jgi:lysophospholipase L1-like esterase
VKAIFVAFVAAAVAFGGAVAVTFVLRDDSGATTPDNIYISLGDSVAAGNGVSEPETAGFVAVLARSRRIDHVYNVARPGAASGDVYAQQLASALPQAQAGTAGLITISAGGNDLAGLIPNPDCVVDPLPPTCPLDGALAIVEENLDRIVRDIRDANRVVPVVLLAYPNFFSGTGHAWEAPAGRVLARLNDVIREVAHRYERVAVAEPSFEGRGDELTGVNNYRFDPHPNARGHAIIAEAFARAIDGLE